MKHTHTQKPTQMVSQHPFWVGGGGGSTTLTDVYYHRLVSGLTAGISLDLHSDTDTHGGDQETEPSSKLTFGLSVSCLLSIQHGELLLIF